MILTDLVIVSSMYSNGSSSPTPSYRGTARGLKKPRPVYSGDPGQKCHHFWWAVCLTMFVVCDCGLVGNFGVSFAFSHTYSSSNFGGTLVGWCYACNVLWISLFRLFRQILSQCLFSKAVCSQAWLCYIYFVDLAQQLLVPSITPTFKIMVALRTCKLKKTPFDLSLNFGFVIWLYFWINPNVHCF